MSNHTSQSSLEGESSVSEKDQRDVGVISPRCNSMSRKVQMGRRCYTPRIFTKHIFIENITGSPNGLQIAASK